MSKTKTKGVKDTKPTDILSKVKDAAITKPAQTLKAKGKELAKQVAAKEEKKPKKIKQPTPEPSDSEDSVSSESESESDSEVEPKKSAVNGKAGGAKATTKKEELSDASESESDSEDEESEEDSEESESEVEAPKTNGANVAAKADDSSDESDEDSEAEAAVAPTKAAPVPAPVNDDDDEDSDDDSSESDSEGESNKKSAVLGKKLAASKAKADSSDDDSDDSDSDSSEVEAKAAPAKRKAEEAVTPATKKTKTDIDTSRGPNLFIGNLSWNVDEEWLQQEFSSYGEISGVRLMTDRQTGRSKGFGYVEFVNAADAAKAHAEKQGAELDGRVMNVDFANARPTQSQAQDNRRKSFGDQVSDPTDTLFVGNLAFDVGQESVSEAFAPHGTVLGVRLPTDRETGAPKGFGYVTFASVEEAQAALTAMQGFYLENRPLRLDFSQPRAQTGDSPARGGFGGRGRGGFGGGRGGRGGNGGGRGGPRGRGRGGQFNSTNRGGFGDFSGRKTTF